MTSTLLSKYILKRFKKIIILSFISENIHLIKSETLTHFRIRFF